MIKTLKSNKLFAILLIIFIGCFILNPKTYMNATINGLSLWFYNVLPALLPFFIATKLLLSLNLNTIKPMDYLTKKCFGVKCGNIFLLSILSGYPVGARLISSSFNTGNHNRIESKKMLSFCSTSGPMFIIGTIGIGVFKSVRLGYLLLICHILGAITNGIFFNIFSKKGIKHNTKQVDSSIKRNTNILADSIYDSMISIMLVGMYIVLAYIFIELLTATNVLPIIANFISNITKIDTNLIKSFISGLIEITKGNVELGQLSLSLKTNLILSSFIIAFGGFSIFLQSLDFTKNLQIKKSFFLFQKLCQGIWTLLFAFLISLFI